MVKLLLVAWAADNTISLGFLLCVIFYISILIKPFLQHKNIPSLKIIYDTFSLLVSKTFSLNKKQKTTAALICTNSESTAFTVKRIPFQYLLLGLHVLVMLEMNIWS